MNLILNLTRSFISLHEGFHVNLIFLFVVVLAYFAQAIDFTCLVQNIHIMTHYLITKLEIQNSVRIILHIILKIQTPSNNIFYNLFIYKKFLSKTSSLSFTLPIFPKEYYHKGVLHWGFQQQHCCRKTSKASSNCRKNTKQSDHTGVIECYPKC